MLSSIINQITVDGDYILCYPIHSTEVKYVIPKSSIPFHNYNELELFEISYDSYTTSYISTRNKLYNDIHFIENPTINIIEEQEETWKEEELVKDIGVINYMNDDVIDSINRFYLKYNRLPFKTYRFHYCKNYIRSNGKHNRCIVKIHLKTGDGWFWMDINVEPKCIV